MKPPCLVSDVDDKLLWSTQVKRLVKMTDLTNVL